MKLKDILLEGRTKPLDLNEARKIFNENIASVYNPNKNDNIYRGVSKDFNVGLIRPSQYKRESAHTDNYYTLIMDNVPEWDEFPKRSRSMVCTSSSGEAKDYGDVFKVFPFAISKLGVAPTNDIWKSFQIDLFHVNSYINVIVDYIDEDRETVPTSSFSEFKSYLSDISEKLDSEEFIKAVRTGKVSRNKGVQDFILKYFNSNAEDLFTFYRSIVHPSMANLRSFEVEYYDGNFQIRGGSYPGREIWTSSPCLLLRWDEEFLEKFFKDKKFYMKDIDQIPV